ncbi:MAG: nucleotidyltransferase domain-containing protein [Anaerolineae bacterium]|nr:nucleotidyltransferase domain-containing protein [Anaerolineae bacterium]
MSETELAELQQVETDSHPPGSMERKRLLARELARYLRVLAKEGDSEQVIVFGSLATGKVQPWSNIDLVIVQQTSLPFLQRLHRVRRLLRPRVGTDILVYTPEEYEQLRRERPFFREEILGKGVVVYERSG